MKLKIDQLFNPFIIVILIIIIFSIAMAFTHEATEELTNTQIFILAGTGILVNGFYQAILLFRPKNISSLLPKVIFCIFLGLIAITLIALFISGKSWAEIGFIITFVFVFLILVSIIVVSKQLIEFAQKNDR